MKSLILLGLTGLAANVQAHPQRRDPHSADLSRRGLDLEKFRLPEISDYTVSTVAKDDVEIQAIGKRATYVETAQALAKKVLPDTEFRVVGDHYVDVDGIAHVNLKQTVHGIDIDNADFNVNIGRDGKVFSYGNSFYTGKIPAQSPLKKRAFSDPIVALKGAVETLGLPVKTAQITAKPKEGTEKYTLKGAKGTVSDPEARLVYLTKADGKLVLTWRVETDVDSNWLLTYVDAANTKQVHGVVDYVSDLATLEVYPWGINDPTEGQRTVVEDPWTIETSAFTWFGDGASNYTTTRGNNGIAQVNPTGGSAYLNNYRPNSPERKFEYKYSTELTKKEDYWDASITQLYYTANKYHDLLYTLGFNEPAGNFQTNNNGKGGAGNDFVILNAQDGSGTNNANFATPADGSPGRMRMYMWNKSTPNRDCSFEAGVVIHEYSHGLSNRLTGGPANAGCLSGLESGGMGEGWGDFMATAIRLKKDDTRATDYPMGSWVFNDAKGIRAYPYSTSLTTNPLTYKATDKQFGVHAIGTIWCSTLYEVLWNLIDKHGKNDAELPTFDAEGVPTDGKYLAMKLVVSGMALQPCNPTFISARDAILDADKSLTGGKNQCELWKGFAKRGLGEKAKYSSSSRTEDFTVPATAC